MNYSDRIFRRGFVLSEGSLHPLESSPIGQYLHSYVRTHFGPMELWYDPLLNVTSRSNPGLGVAMLGLAVNPFDGLGDNQGLVAELYKCLVLSENRFLDYVDQLTGTFVILFRTNDQVFVLQDAAAVKPVYYARRRSGELVVSSHVGILAVSCDLEPSARADVILKNPDYLKDVSRYLPGLITPYDGANPLTANNLLACSKRRTRRFFPREPLDPVVLDTGYLKELGSLFRIQAAILSKKRKVAIAVTAGRDSRLTLASFENVSPGSFCFTFHNSITGQFDQDVTIASELVRIKGFLHRIFAIEKYSSRRFLEALRVHSPHRLWSTAAQLYTDEFPEEIVHVRSTVSEVGRCFYRKNRGNNNFDAKRLAEAYTWTASAKSNCIVEIFEEFMNGANFRATQFFNYDYLDLFYWEHRNSKWQNVLCSEAEMASDVFVPYNNRAILKRFLAIPLDYRLQAAAHLGVIDQLEPRFESVPLDSNA